MRLEGEGSGGCETGNGLKCRLMGYDLYMGVWICFWCVFGWYSIRLDTNMLISGIGFDFQCGLVFTMQAENVSFLLFYMSLAVMRG